jgi:PAS domain S-box-containing protein
MPGIDGIELLKTIKKNFPESMVIMLTAFSSTESAIRSLNAGAFAYLNKPVNPDELNATLKNAYRSYALSRENTRLVEELRKAKEYNEAIIENLIYLIVATDAAGTIKKVNRAVVNLLHYSEEELIGAPVTTLFSAEFQYNAWHDMVKGNRVTDFPVSFRAKNGREITLHFTGTIMKNTEGQVLGFLGTAKA